MRRVNLQPFFLFLSLPVFHALTGVDLERVLEEKDRLFPVGHGGVRAGAEHHRFGTVGFKDNVKVCAQGLKGKRKNKKEKGEKERKKKERRKKERKKEEEEEESDTRMCFGGPSDILYWRLANIKNSCSPPFVFLFFLLLLCSLWWCTWQVVALLMTR